MTPKQRIDDFLARKRIAIAGVSRSPADFTRLLFREFVRRGYDAVPVNPLADGPIDGQTCFRSVREIEPPVEGVLILTNRDAAPAVLEDCAAAGIRRVWLYKAVRHGAVSPTALDFCAANGIEVVPGECPFMFFPNPGFHGIHGLFRKFVGRYPK